MLPILRIIPVGGVSLAIAILVLALSPPGGLRPPLTRTMMPARGPLITRSDHPEWRQLLINAALRRADELSQLRQLPDTPLHSEISEPDKPTAENAETAPEVAGVPPSRSDAEPEDVTGTIAPSPDAAIPVGVGEASSFEWRVFPQEEKPPVIRTPERSQPPRESLNVAPDSAKPAQEQESAKAALEPNKPAEDTAKAAPEPAKPAQESVKAALEPAKSAQESKKAEDEPVKPARESRRRVRHRHYASAAVKPPPPINFNLFEILFNSFNLDPRTGKPRR
jgi:hypothetical protein